jgi:hypothetical protein
MVHLIALFVLKTAWSEPKSADKKTVEIKISDIKAVMPADSMVGDCKITFSESKDITGATDITISDLKTSKTVTKTFNPNNRRNVLEKELDIGPKNQYILTHPGSLVGGNWKEDEINKYGWIRLFNDANNREGILEEKSVDLSFYYDKRTQRITGLAYESSRSGLKYIAGKPQMDDFLICGNVKEKETNRVKSTYDVHDGPRVTD